MTVKNFFGTDGIRGAVGTGLFVRDQVPILGHALGAWCMQRFGSAPKVLLLHDTRASCGFMKAALKSGLMLHPVTTYDAGVLPTPAALHLMMNGSFDAAIIISASHNPWYDTGIKIMDRTGKLSLHDEQAISELIATAHNQCLSYTMFGSNLCIPEAQQLYVERVCAFFNIGFLTGTKVVLDAANGATYLVAPEVFRALGAEVIMINDQPTGYNINEQCGALHPEELCAAVLEHKADVGFAFDGDGDRIIAVNKRGEIKDGDDILALLSQHPAYCHEKTIVGTVMSNHGLALFLREQGKELVRTAVGDKYVLERLVVDNALLGGEPAGHVILRDLLPTGDGILVAVRVLEAMMFVGDDGMGKFTKCPQVLINIPLTVSRERCEQPLADIVAAAQEGLKDGRVLVRFSGTEPILRIMVEASSQHDATDVATSLSSQIQKTLDMI